MNCTRMLFVRSRWLAIRLLILTTFITFIFTLMYRQQQEKATISSSPSSTLSGTMQSLAKEGKIFISTMDINYFPMVLNLYLTSYVPHHINNYLFIATDEKSCAILDKYNINCFHYLNMTNSKYPSVFSSLEFKRKSYVRPMVVVEGLKAELTVILLDLDIVFVRNPDSYLKCSNCDLLFQQETGRNNMNGGLYLVKPTKAGLELQERSLAKMSLTNPTHGDQIYFNQVLAEMRKKKEIKAEALNAEYFPNGLRFFERGHRMFKRDNPCKVCVAIHNNYVVSLQAKRYRFKELGLWLVDTDGYYSSQERKYLQFHNPVDFGNQTTTEMERKSLMAAFLIGHILNRTVILPKFHCYDVKMYNAVKGQLCNFAAHYSIRKFEEFTTDYRENIFLESDLVPQVVKDSVSKTFAIESTAWRKYFSSNLQGVTVLETGGDEVSTKQIKAWFSSTDVSILRFHSLYNDIKGGNDDDDAYMTGLRKAIKRTDFRQLEN